jgi:hypothetical protein
MLLPMTLVTVGGPTWTDIPTAIGTVGAVFAAVLVALWSDWQPAEERRVALGREQLAEAYAVRIMLGSRRVGASTRESGASARRVQTRGSTRSRG